MTGGKALRRRVGGIAAAALATAAAGGTALAHDLDHPAPSFSEAAPLSSTINAGGENAQWELVATLPTGNPHSDLDFFTVGGITYASVGTLAGGANAAGQNIVQLTNEDGEVDPHYVTGHPSATCPGVATGVTGLQHDAEATPKGDALVQFPNPFVDTRDTQLVLDATDAPGRCHDQGTLAISGAGRGGLEILDVTEIANADRESMEIGLTTHAGQAHTVNVDPKRPHIAFVSSSDAVTFDEEGTRANDEGTSSSMDGIEVVDLSSCMNFPAGAPRQFKIESCDPDVYRYRWPTADFASSSTFRATAACHELEIYPDDRVTCAAVNATLLLDFSGAFDDNGTPNDYSDDKPRGTPLPCARRESSTAADPWHTSAFVEDCVVGEDGQDLRVGEWLTMTPRPELEGVEKIGAVHHMGFEDQIRENASAPYEASEDIFVSHEAELTQSGRYILATDERGGGVLPIGASCSPGADNPLGNGGIHAYPTDKLGTAPPAPTGEANDAVAAYQEQVYAKNSEGERAIFRAPTETEPQGSLCTAHVFQQIPGQNRIFMGWYSQGTQVVDFTENADGTIDFERAGYFVPEHANQWTSHVFKVQENTDGTFTYWGATGDFLLGDAGRNAIDVYKVTLPPPPRPRTESGDPPAGTPSFPVGPPGTEAPATTGTGGQADAPACASAAAFDTIDAKPRRKRRRVRFRFSTRTDEGVTARIFRRSKKRLLMRRKVKTFRNRDRGFVWAPRRARNGFYDVRLVGRTPNGKKDRRHVALRRKRGRFRVLQPYDRRSSCDLVKYATLGKPVFGGRKGVPLRIRFRLAQPAEVGVRIERRNGKLVRQRRAREYARGKHGVMVRLGRRKARRGVYRITIEAERPGRSSDVTLFARYL